MQLPLFEVENSVASVQVTINPIDFCLRNGRRTLPCISSQAENSLGSSYYQFVWFFRNFVLKDSYQPRRDGYNEFASDYIFLEDFYQPNAFPLLSKHVH